MKCQTQAKQQESSDQLSQSEKQSQAERTGRRADDQEEVWKDVKGYEGFYTVSNMGNIMSLDRIVSGGGGRKYKKYSQLLRPGISTNGHLLVVLNKFGKQEPTPVHTLVSDAFLGRRGNYNICVNHKNGIKTDNRLCNLELVTKGYDIKHAYSLGLRSAKKDRNPNRKLSSNDIPKIFNMRDQGISRKDIAKKFNVTIWCINGVLYHGNWR